MSFTPARQSHNPDTFCLISMLRLLTISVSSLTVYTSLHKCDMETKAWYQLLPYIICMILQGYSDIFWYYFFLLMVPSASSVSTNAKLKPNIYTQTIRVIYGMIVHNLVQIKSTPFHSPPHSDPHHHRLLGTFRESCASMSTHSQLCWKK